MKRQILGNLYGLLIASASFAGALLMITLLAGRSNPASLANIVPLYYVVLFVGGFVFTSNIFSELHSTQRSIPFLTLPVSSFERFANSWLLTAIIYPLLALLVFTLIIFLSHLILGINFENGAFSAVWSAEAIKIVWIYVITQSIFLFGAIYFRKHNFIKTLLSLFVIPNIIGLFLFIAGYLVFGTLNFGNSEFIHNSSLSPGLETLITKTIPEVSKFAFNYLIIPFFLTLTWFGIKERQV